MRITSTRLMENRKTNGYSIFVETCCCFWTLQIAGTRGFARLFIECSTDGQSWIEAKRIPNSSIPGVSGNTYGRSAEHTPIICKFIRLRIENVTAATNLTVDLLQTNEA